MAHASAKSAGSLCVLSPIAAASIYVVKPGRTEEFIALTKQSSEAVQKVGKAGIFHVYRTSYGGNWGELHVVAGCASLADIPTSGAATRAAMGDAAYTTDLEMLTACINSVGRNLYRYRPEFSYVPAK
jgi:hypothetical protein